MDPQTRATYQARVQFLIQNGYPPDSAQQVALQEVQAQGGGQPGQQGASASMAQGLPGAGDPASAPTGGPVASAPPPMGPPSTGMGTGAMRDQRGAPPPQAPPTPGTAASVASQVAGPTQAGPNQGPPSPPPGSPPTSTTAGGPPGAGGAGAPPPPNGSAYNAPQGAGELASFGLGDNEFGDAWGSKVYQNANPGLYDPNTRNSPWGQFLLEHYGTGMQAATSEGLLNGLVTDQSSSPAFAREQVAQQAMGGGAAAGANQISGLSQAAHNIADAGAGKTFDNLTQNTSAHGLADDNQGQANLVREGLNGVGGGWGRNYINSVLASQSAESANNPQQYGPGQWALAALNKLGVQ